MPALHLVKQESQLIRYKDPLCWDLVCGSWGKVVPKLGRLETRPYIRASTGVPSTGDSEGCGGLPRKCCL